MSTSLSLSMILRTLIVDDEPIALEKLRAYVSKVPYLTLAGECTDGLEAVERLTSGLEVDLIITDISMPDLDGMEMIRALPSPPMVIFTTAFDRYAVDSYRLSAVDYLLKPYGFADFQRATAKALDAFSSHRPSHSGDSLFVKVDYRYIRVSLSDILYIKGYGEYLQIYLSGAATPLLTLSSFAAIKERLTDNFLQVHRSFIVNMNHVSQIERARIVIPPDTYIPVGESYKPAFLNYITSHSVGKK